jgi:hypothetical protein
MNLSSTTNLRISIHTPLRWLSPFVVAEGLLGMLYFLADQLQRSGSRLPKIVGLWAPLRREWRAVITERFEARDVIGS